jgi:hypothetical protein
MLLEAPVTRANLPSSFTGPPFANRRRAKFTMLTLKWLRRQHLREPRTATAHYRSRARRAEHWDDPISADLFLQNLETQSMLMRWQRSRISRCMAPRLESVAGPKVLGVTKDGVRILKPKGKAAHFTQKELRDAVAAARASKRA